MEIIVKLPTLIYWIIMAVLILLVVYPRDNNYGGYIDTSGYANVFWFLVAIVFTLIYGGFYFW